MSSMKFTLGCCAVELQYQNVFSKFAVCVGHSYTGDLQPMGHRLDMTAGASEPGIQVTSPTYRLIAGAQPLASRSLGVKPTLNAMLAASWPQLTLCSVGSQLPPHRLPSLSFFTGGRLRCGL